MSLLHPRQSLHSTPSFLGSGESLCVHSWPAFENFTVTTLPRQLSLIKPDLEDSSKDLGVPHFEVQILSTLCRVPGAGKGLSLPQDSLRPGPVRPAQCLGFQMPGRLARASACGACHMPAHAAASAL